MKPPSPDQSESRSSRCARILHAEDDPVTALRVASFLMEKGHHLETATNGREALTRIVAQTGCYDVLITDHVMPALSGLECVTALRKIGYLGEVIVFASSLSAEVTEQYAAIGVCQILQKSSDLAPLHKAIIDALAVSASASPRKEFLPLHKQDAPARSAEASVESGVGEQQQDRQDKL